jgi:hypothetical protein
MYLYCIAADHAVVQPVIPVLAAGYNENLSSKQSPMSFTQVSMSRYVMPRTRAALAPSNR